MTIAAATQDRGQTGTAVATTGNGAGKTSPIQHMRAQITSAAMTDQFRMALPKGVSVERFQRVLLTALQNNPKLLEVDQRSVLSEAMKAAQLGLFTDGILGEAYLINAFDRGRQVAQMRVGYRGLMKLARQSGEIASLYAHEVCEGDEFSYRYGLDRDLRHVPAAAGRGALTHVYAVAKFRDGSDPDFLVMSRAAVEEIRDNYSDGWRAFKSGKIKATPWSTSFEAMAKKTVIRALCKTLPQSPELQRAVALDDAAENGRSGRIEQGEVLLEAPEPPAIEDQRPSPLDRFEAESVQQDPEQTSPHDPDTGEVLDAAPAKPATAPDPFDIPPHLRRTAPATAPESAP